MGDEHEQLVDEAGREEPAAQLWPPSSRSD